MEIFGEIHENAQLAANMAVAAEGAWKEGQTDRMKECLRKAHEALDAARREVETYYRFLAGPGG